MASHGAPRAFRARLEGQRAQDLEKIKTYCDLENQIRAQVASGTYGLALFHLTTKLLHLNPEYYTIWNVRRRCLISGLLFRKADQRGPSDAQDPASDAENHQESDAKVLQSELAFTIPLLMKFPKCYWIWNFRRWTLSQCILRLPVPVARKIWEAELDLVSKLLNQDQRNFHGWNYRRFVVTTLESSELVGKSMAEDEFAYTTRMIESNLSNFSAWHNRSLLIPRVLDERGADDKTRAVFLVEELDFVRRGLDVGPEDQSLWFYHQFLMSQIIINSGNRQTIVPALAVDERIVYIQREIDEIKDLLVDYANVKWIYEALLEYTLARERLEQRAERDGGETTCSLRAWLAKLRALDPMRTGRWNDVGREMGL
ncbi:Rab geranylgeranyltransferase [Parahypoxylon ruwenzoriense]